MSDILDRVDPDELRRLEEYACVRCGTKPCANLTIAGPHIKASCFACGAYIKFVRQKLPPEERAYWDARKAQ